MVIWVKQIGAHEFKIRAAQMQDRAAVNAIIHYWAEQYQDLTLRLFKFEEVLNEKPVVCQINSRVIGYADSYRVFLTADLADNTSGIGTTLLAAYMHGIDESKRTVRVAMLRRYYGKMSHILEKLA